MGGYIGWVYEGADKIPKSVSWEGLGYRFMQSAHSCAESTSIQAEKQTNFVARTTTGWALQLLEYANSLIYPLKDITIKSI